MKKWNGIIVLGIAGLILTAAIYIQIKTVNKMTEGVGLGVKENTELKDEYLKWKDRYEGADSELNKAEEKLETVRNQAASNNEGDVIKEAELKQSHQLLGLTEVKGNGITIVIDDNRDVNSVEIVNLNDFLIHEEDILNIVNELFNAGADAVSINDQRVVNTTAIVCDGNIIRVNNEKTGVPITIRAIGYTERLFYAMTRPGGYLDIMKNDGVYVLPIKEDNVTIPKYGGIYNYEYIEK